MRPWSELYCRNRSVTSKFVQDFHGHVLHELGDLFFNLNLWGAAVSHSAHKEMGWMRTATGSQIDVLKTWRDTRRNG